ncbi:uncharacterized protein SPSK_05629 [Sporothrix schenckii 1099-18]|uniref:Uncharacterized protein n=1 Tax=Sporothrix schenckii 1099-18 TaxID=1397361 RepID=A0A0F2LS89_SPOSC|nr:uncharacterized protein SPSK_05629 [Sporothrix schenckii 1099-18]KJR80357.1 hypothetical protein SPSK_05629 [Sporothrix schenckii 1099-18]
MGKGQRAGPVDWTANFHGHVEADGAVSIEAAHHDGTANSSHIASDYGRSQLGVLLLQLTLSQEPSKDSVTAALPALTVSLSPLENSIPTRPWLMRVTSWSTGVVASVIFRCDQHPLVVAIGAWEAQSCTMAITKLVVDVGGLKAQYVGSTGERAGLSEM